MRETNLGTGTNQLVHCVEDTQNNVSNNEYDTEVATRSHRHWCKNNRGGEGGFVQENYMSNMN